MTAFDRPFRSQRIRRAALAALSASTLLAAPTALAAPIDAENAACRAAISKSVSKLVNTTMKAYDGCIKAGLKGDPVDCSDHVTADLKSKIDDAQGKLDDAIADKCDDTTHAIALGEFQRCGPPTGTAITGFGTLPGCLNDMIPESIDSLRNFILNPNFSTATGEIAKCINAIAKSSTKLMKAVQKVKHKIVKAEDELGYDSDYFDPGDPDGKIADAFVKSLIGISSACEELTNIEWKAVTSCDNNPIDAPICIVTNVLQLADGLTAAAYDLPGVCPGYLDVLFLDGAEGGVVKRRTDIDLGWTGNAHQVDSNGYFYQSFDMDCGGANDNDCSFCTLSASCDSGNCRCRNDNSLFCDQPFAADPLCGGNTCDMLFGPPVPVPTGGTPICLVQRIEGSLGNASYENGATDVTFGLRSMFHSGVDHATPCPVCNLDGFCEGGERDGLSCFSDGLSDFGETSYDCPPTSVSNLTGAGILSTSASFTSDDTFPAMLPCDAPLESSFCYCSACSGDPTVPCNSDSTCTFLGIGHCGTSPAEHLGAARKPNDCSDLLCTAVVGETGEGECAADEESWCSGIVKGNGDGVVACTNNADCDAVAGAGTCTQERNRRCFLQPIVADGAGGPRIGVDSGVLASAQCMPATSVPALNTAFGLPGPVRTTLAVEFYSVCPNGFNLWSPGGAVCN